MAHIIKNNLVFFILWLLSGLLQFCCLFLVFADSLQVLQIVKCVLLLISSGFLYFLLPYFIKHSSAKVWPLSFFNLSVFFPGISWFFIPLFWFQSTSSKYFQSSYEELKRLPLYQKPQLISDYKQKVQQELDLEPYADILAGDDLELKRGAIEKMVEIKNRECIALLEKYRESASAELRFYVLSALHRIRQDYEQELETAKLEMKKNLYKVSARIYLAKVYFQYVLSGLPDENSKSHFLEDAAFHLQESLASPHAHAHAAQALLELRIYEKKYDEAITLLELGKQCHWFELDLYFQKKCELLYLKKHFVLLFDFVSQYKAEMFKQSESKQILFQWGEAAFGK